MATDLPILQLNAKKWREENGFTGKEWIQYRNHWIVHSTIFEILIAITAMYFGYLAGAK